MIEKHVGPGENGSKNILEPGGTEFTTAAGGARRYRKPLKALRWRDIKSLLSDSFDGWSRHNATRLGASLAFYTLLSLAPLLLVVISVAGLVLGHSAAERQILQQVQKLTGPAGVSATRAFFEGSRNTTHGIIATVAGLVTLLFSASSMVIELRDTLNIIWEVPSPRSSGLRILTAFVKQRLFSFVIVISIGFLLIVSLVASTWISALGAFSASLFPGEQTVLQVVNSLISFVVIGGLFAAIYKIMPDVKIQWRDVTLGGAVTSLLFTLGKLLLGFYLGRASYASTYGAAASTVILIVWIYYSAQIFFLGAELTKTFAQKYGSQPALHVLPETS